MAESNGKAEKSKGYWRDVKLQYSDGVVITACLDRKTLERLEQGDNELMEQIRTNMTAAEPSEQSNSPAEPSEQSNSPAEPSEQSNSPAEPSKQSNSRTQSDPVGSTECSPANCVKKNWAVDETRMLFHLRSSMEEEFQSHKVHIGLWGKIQESMNKEGIEVTAKQCENKFKSLKRDYKAAVDNNKTSGNSPKSCQFFDEFNELYGLKAGTRPAFTLSSMEECPSSSPENMENISKNKKNN